MVYPIKKHSKNIRGSIIMSIHGCKSISSMVQTNSLMDAGVRNQTPSRQPNKNCGQKANCIEKNGCENLLH